MKLCLAQEHWPPKIKNDSTVKQTLPTLTVGGLPDPEEGVLTLSIPRELGGSLVEWDRWESFRLTLGRRPTMTGKNCWPLVLQRCWTDSMTDSSSRHCCLHCFTYSNKCCVSSASLCRVSSDSNTNDVPVFSMILMFVEFIVNLAPVMEIKFVSTIAIILLEYFAFLLQHTHKKLE